jgi:hypothetical protein
MSGTPVSALVPILVLLPILATDFSSGFLEVNTPTTWFVCCYQIR